MKYKAGDKRDINNHRPVSIPDVGRKVLARALHKRLVALQDFWPPLHHSWKGRRTADSLTSLQMVISRIRSGQESPALLLAFDFEKAANRVDHGWLLSTLADYGFAPRMRAMVRVMLRNAHVSSGVNGWHTSPTQLKSGLGQGDPAPLLLLASLLPLLDGLEAAGGGITLGASRHGPQPDLPYLAYGDDIATFARLP